MNEQEAAVQRAAKESEKRKKMLKEKLLPQPGAETATGTADPELEGPDQAAHTLSRAESQLLFISINSLYLNSTRRCLEGRFRDEFDSGVGLFILACGSPSAAKSFCNAHRYNALTSK